VSHRTRADPYLPPGPARDLVDLFKRLRSSRPLRVGQIAARTGYAPSHISEVLRGLKAPSPEAAAKIAQVLGADASTIMRARSRAEDLREWKREFAGARDQAPNLPAAATRADLPEPPLQRKLSYPDVIISIIAGDLLDQDTHLAVSFSDTFDTSTTDNRIIHSTSIQGQLLQRLYDDDQHRLDSELSAALGSVLPVRLESRDDKPLGKLARYPIGTVAVLGEPGRRIFGVAYGWMGNDLIVRAPVEQLWHCYAQLWEAVYRHGQRGTLSIPLMGSGLSRVDTLDRDNLLQLILLSFVAYSRFRLICHELRIVILPRDVPAINFAGLPAFLQAL
jgi:transcriptional regulator with XRE-family HTH domain